MEKQGNGTIGKPKSNPMKIRLKDIPFIIVIIVFIVLLLLIANNLYLIWKYLL
jgi:hypothetical protein